MKTFSSLAFAALSAAAFLSPPAVAVAPDGLHCGGVGADERRAMAQEGRNASLQMQFHVAGRAAFIADVDVTVTPSKGGGEAISTRADGPICYANLAPGRYDIQATFNGVTRTAHANVTANGRPVTLSMGFPPAGGPDDLDTQPSAEERAEARAQ